MVSQYRPNKPKNRKKWKPNICHGEKFPLTITLNDGLVWCVRAHTRATEHDRMSKLTNEQMNGETSTLIRLLQMSAISQQNFHLHFSVKDVEKWVAPYKHTASICNNPIVYVIKWNSNMKQNCIHSKGGHGEIAEGDRARKRERQQRRKTRMAVKQTIFYGFCLDQSQPVCSLFASMHPLILDYVFFAGALFFHFYECIVEIYLN